MTDRDRAMAALAEAGATFEEFGAARGELIGAAYTPPGRVWRATDAHTLGVHFYTDRAAGWRALADDAEDGTDPCDDSGCEVCHD